MTPAQFTKLLQDVRSAFRDIFERNYFITSYMTKQLTTPWMRGTVPVMATMMALMNRQHHENRADRFVSGTDPSLRSRRRQKTASVDARRCASNSSIQTTGTQQLYYVSLDATDKALEFYPDFMNWVSSIQAGDGIIKSASYLLHDNQFAKTRSMLLEAADVVVQDDTGIPYRYSSARSHGR